MTLFGVVPKPGVDISPLKGRGRSSERKGEEGRIAGREKGEQGGKGRREEGFGETMAWYSQPRSRGVQNSLRGLCTVVHLLCTNVGWNTTPLGSRILNTAVAVFF